MSLLDADAEELKARGALPASSGRKANQSGLGALKSLSKYSNLTAKYRATQAAKEESPSAVAEAPIVEHSRGTISSNHKSVQSQCDIAPAVLVESTNEPSLNRPDVSANTHGHNDVEVSAELNQSQCRNELIADSSTKEIISNKVDAKSVRDTDFSTTNTDNLPICEQVYSVDNIPSNQIKSLNSQCKVSAIENNDLVFTQETEGLQSQCKTTPESDFTVFNSIALLSQEVSAIMHPQSNLSREAKSVQSPCADEPSEVFSTTNSLVEQNRKVSSDLHPLNIVDVNSTQSISKFKLSNSEESKNSTLKTEVSAKSVRHKMQASAIVSANTVQSPCEVSSVVSAKIKTLEDEFLLPTESALTVVGSQKTILDFIYEQCVWNQGLVTGPITKVQLIEATKLNEETALSAIKRLRKKRMIDRHSYKDGKAGWTKYRLAELSYKEILTFRQNYQSSYLLAQQSQGKVSSVVSAAPPSKIDSNLNNITNYTSAPTYFNSWFKTLNFNPVHPINPMQVNSSIRRLVEERLELEDAQNFINRFMTWLSSQGKVNSPIAIFCDKFKEYANEGDSAVLYVKTKEEIQIELEFAQNTEKMRQEIELIEKAKAFEKAKQDDQNFESWYLTATDDELLQLQQPNSFVEFKSEIYKKSIKGIYLEKYISANHG